MEKETEDSYCGSSLLTRSCGLAALRGSVLRLAPSRLLARPTEGDSKPRAAAKTPVSQDRALHQGERQPRGRESNNAPWKEVEGGEERQPEPVHGCRAAGI